MFLGMLNDEEKRAFIALAERMIETDELAVTSELAALEAMRRELGLRPDETGGDEPAEELARSFTSRRSKVAALLELVGLGYSDESFSIEEESFVDVVAQEMDIGRDELEQIEAWVRRHIALVDEAMRLMQG